MKYKLEVEISHNVAGTFSTLTLGRTLMATAVSLLNKSMILNGKEQTFKDKVTGSTVKINTVKE